MSLHTRMHTHTSLMLPPTPALALELSGALRAACACLSDCAIFQPKSDASLLCRGPDGARRWVLLGAVTAVRVAEGGLLFQVEHCELLPEWASYLPVVGSTPGGLGARLGPRRPFQQYQRRRRLRQALGWLKAGNDVIRIFCCGKIMFLP